MNTQKHSKHSVLRTILRTIKIITTLTIVMLVLSAVLIGAVYFHFAKDLPNIKSFEDYKPPVVSEVYAQDGTKVGEFWTECRYLTPISKIPKKLIHAFVAGEDSRFFEHRGVDVRGIGRAMFENLKAGHIVQGGSTITQQLTRSILLSREKKYARKIREAILATRIERQLSKEQILELYLNQIYLGNRAYGVAAAARNYFNKDLDQITNKEAAMIAGLTKAPSTDSPIQNPKGALERTEYVLQRMYEQGYITKQDYQQAKAETLTIHFADIDKDFNYKYTPYFTEFVRRYIIDKYGEKVLYEGGLKIHTTVDLNMYKAAEKALRMGLERLDKRQGYRGIVAQLGTSEIEPFTEQIHKEIIKKKYGNTIRIPENPADAEAKKTAPTPLEEDQLYKGVIIGFGDGGKMIVQVGRASGVITPKNYGWAGKIFNIHGGGYDGGIFIREGKSKWKIGDVVMVQKAPEEGEFIFSQIPAVQGAIVSIDPHTGYVKAHIGGYDYALSEFDRASQSLRQPGSSFKPYIYAAALDKGYTYNTPISDSPVTYQVGIGQFWTPKNYGAGYSGGTTFESDLVYSRNVPTVKIVHDIGTHYLTAFCRKMGLTNPFMKYLSMALGANGLYLYDHVAAMSTFINQGIRPPRTYVIKIEDTNGNTIEEHKEPPMMTPVEEAVQIAKSTNPDSGDLNQPLWDLNKKYVEEDGLKLSDSEMKILYGSAIAPGYTVTPQTAYLITHLMEEVVQKGTGTRVKEIGKPAAGKTGTTNDETDTWFIGFVPDLGAGVWVGFDNIQPLGRGEQGGRTAAPIVRDYFKIVTEGWEAKPFPVAPGIDTAKIATMKGGSAIYWTGKDPDPDYLGTGGYAGSTGSVRDRADDFYEEDIGGFAKPSGGGGKKRGGGGEAPMSDF